MSGAVGLTTSPDALSPARNSAVLDERYAARTAGHGRAL